MDVEKILREFKKKVKKFYGSKLKDVILYGSWARDDATDDSDIDIIVVLGYTVIPGKEIDNLIDIITDINLKYNTLISVYPVSENDYKTLKSPLLLNVRREGLSI